MKMIYEAPAMYAEAFAPNQYVAACTNPVFDTDVPPMEVRCQSKGHQNIASTNIFFDDNEQCAGKYNPNAAGSGYVQGVWGTTYNSTENKNVDWFYEDSNNNRVIDNSEIGGRDPVDTDFTNFTTAFKGWFRTWETVETIFGDVSYWVGHLFYARTEQVAQYNVS